MTLANEQLGAPTDHDAHLYMHALTDAIHAYGNSIEQFNPLAFRYRGVSLRRAAEVHLFFALVNYQPLYLAFRDQPVAQDDLSYIALLVLPFMAAPPTGRPRPDALSLVRALKTVLVEKTSRAAAPPPCSVSYLNCAGDCRILVHVGAPRFASYFARIKPQLRDQAAYLVLDDAALANQLAASGQPVVSVVSRSCTVPSHPITLALRDWASTCCRVDVWVSALTSTKCRTLVVIEGSSPAHEEMVRAAQSIGVRTVCVQQGWAPLIHTGFRNMRFDAMCVWGAQFAKLLSQHNPKQAFVITGSHVLPEVGNSAQKLPTGIGFFLQRGSILLNEAAWHHMLDFVEWTARKYPNHSIIVRDHPNGALTDPERQQLLQFPNVKLAPNETVSLSQVLAECKCVVSVFSTTLIEAAVIGSIPLIVNITGMPRFSPDLEEMRAGVEVQDFGSARLALTKIMADHLDEWRRRMREVEERLVARRGQQACEQTARVIVSTSNREITDLIFKD